MLNVQILSRETIKPSSPTPQNLRYLQLSLLDQLSYSPLHIPLILFYSGDETAGISSRLKKSLSEVLTRFYPLAGRIEHDHDSGHLHVDCNDQGAEFYEAKVDCRLSGFLRCPSNSQLSQLFPGPLEVSTVVPLVIQLSAFECGGLAIGIAISHSICDGSSLTLFVNTWTNITQRGNLHEQFVMGINTPEQVDRYEVSPTFGFASLFPPRSMKPMVLNLSSMKQEMAVTKRLLFEASKIALLREKASEGAGFFPSSVEAVSGLIWRCAMRARGKAGLDKSLATHGVNIRQWMDPPMPEYSFGNLWLPVFVTCKRMEGNRVGYLERQLREAIRKVKGDSMQEVLENKGGMFISEPMWNYSDEKWKECGFDLYMFSSWCRFPLYESDFGWGKPEWLCLVSLPVKNMVFLMPTRNGEGIEVLVFMIEEEMSKFEKDEELLAFISYCI